MAIILGISLVCSSSAWASEIHSLLIEKYKSAKLLEAQKSDLISYDFISPNKSSQVDWKNKYKETKEKLKAYREKEQRLKGEIAILEKLNERLVRAGVKELNKDQWDKHLQKLSKLPTDVGANYSPTYFLDLLVAWKQKDWLIQFPKFLVQYLEYSPVNSPNDPFTFTSGVSYESNTEMEVKEPSSIGDVDISKLKKIDSGKIATKPEKIEAQPTATKNKTINDLPIGEKQPDLNVQELKINSTSSNNEILELKTDKTPDAYKTLGFENSGDKTTETENTMKMEVIPTGQAYELKAPKLKKVKKLGL